MPLPLSDAPKEPPPSQHLARIWERSHHAQGARALRSRSRAGEAQLALASLLAGECLRGACSEQTNLGSKASPHFSTASLIVDSSKGALRRLQFPFRLRLCPSKLGPPRSSREEALRLALPRAARAYGGGSSGEIASFPSFARSHAIFFRNALR